MSDQPPDAPKPAEPSVTTKKGQVLTGRRYQRYMTDPAYRAHYDGEASPQPAPRAAGLTRDGVVPRSGSPPAGPSILRKAVNLGADVARHLADSGRKVPLEVYEARLVICKGDGASQLPCEYYRDNHCTHRRCGCMMASEPGFMGMGKTLGALWWASKQCPDDPPRWKAWKVEGAT